MQEPKENRDGTKSGGVLLTPDNIRNHATKSLLANISNNEEKLNTTKDLLNLFLKALTIPTQLKNKQGLFEEIIVTASEAGVPQKAIRLAVDLALEKKYPLRVDLRKKFLSILSLS